jgi:hypothetical protein
MTGWLRTPASVAMYRTRLTSARPPQMQRLPRRLPLSRLKGAKPAKAAICLRLSSPARASGRARSSTTRCRPQERIAAAHQVRAKWEYHESWRRIPHSLFRGVRVLVDRRIKCRRFMLGALLEEGGLHHGTAPAWLVITPVSHTRSRMMKRRASMRWRPAKVESSSGCLPSR